MGIVLSMRTICCTIARRHATFVVLVKFNLPLALIFKYGKFVATRNPRYENAICNTNSSVKPKKSDSCLNELNGGLSNRGIKRDGVSLLTFPDTEKGIENVVHSKHYRPHLTTRIFGVLNLVKIEQMLPV